MTASDIIIRIALAAGAASLMTIGLLIFWPSDEKLHKLRPEDFASEQDFVDYLSSAGRVDKRYEDR